MRIPLCRNWSPIAPRRGKAPIPRGSLFRLYTQCGIMGWNSWNKFAGRVDDAAVRGMAGNGMKQAGYLYINIKDTWEGQRDASGNIRSNKKFPDMKALAGCLHGRVPRTHEPMVDAPNILAIPTNRT